MHKCPHAETREILEAAIAENKRSLKRALLKLRIMSSTWSIAIFTAITLNMGMQETLLFAGWGIYALWAGEAAWEIRNLDKQKNTQVI